MNYYIIIYFQRVDDCDVNDCNEKFDIACDDHMFIGSDEQNENLPKIVKYDDLNDEVHLF